MPNKIQRQSKGYNKTTYVSTENLKRYAHTELLRDTQCSTRHVSLSKRWETNEKIHNLKNNHKTDSKYRENEMIDITTRKAVW